jgi:2-isopropylmalate synthase
VVSEATVKIRVPAGREGGWGDARGERVIATAEGNGPVNALDQALRVGLSRHYPELAEFDLADYKVRILEGSHGTGAVTRVLVETSDRSREWTTVGVHENVVEASWHALVDALTYGIAHTPVPS